MTFRDRFVFAVMIIPVVLVLDQLTKSLILRTDRLRAFECLDPAVPCGKIEVSGIFDISMVWNRGISFGTLQSDGIWRWILVAATIIIACGFAVWLFRSANRITAAALSLVIAGAIGNVIDRVRFGAVVDFLDFSGLWFPYVFNVADSAITVGAALLLLDQLVLSPPQEQSAE